MIILDIPGYHRLQIEHVVMDYNGTLAVDGHLIDGVTERLEQLGAQIGLHVVTADTFGQVRANITGLPCEIHVLPADNQAVRKGDYIRSLGTQNTVAIGNGRNDRLMLETAVLGIGVILGEGAFSDTIAAADVVCTSITEALDLLSQPLRLTATLRG